MFQAHPLLSVIGSYRAVKLFYLSIFSGYFGQTFFMNTTAIQHVMNQISPLNCECWDDFSSYFTERHVRKGDILLKAGEVCKHVYFVNSGLLRCFYYSQEDDREVTGEFFAANCFLTDYFSFATQQPTNIHIQALEDSELISIPRPGIYAQYDKYHMAERFGRLIAEKSFIDMFNAVVIQKTLSPEQRYKILQQERPDLFDRVPLHLIASYLRITPEHLSRIRKKIATTRRSKAVTKLKVA